MSSSRENRKRPGRGSDAGSRASSNASSRKASPLLMARKASPMLGTHPILRYGGDGSGPAPVSAMLLTTSTSTDTVDIALEKLRRSTGASEELAEGAELLYSTSGPLSASDDDKVVGDDEDAVHTDRGGKAAGPGHDRSAQQKRRRLEKKMKLKQKQGGGGKPSASASSSSTAATVKAANPAVVRKELEHLSALFSRVEFALQMHLAPLQQQRSALFPRDIGSLLLWAVPSPVPLIESPRMFFIKNKSRLRDCVVIYVNGWSYDMMMCTGVGLKHRKARAHKDGGAERGREADRATTKTCEDVAKTGSAAVKVPSEASDDSGADDDGVEEVWNEAICSELLRPIRQNACWARQASEGNSNGGVQYSPLFIPNMKNTLEQDLFWRNDAPRTPRDGGSGQRRRPEPVDSDVVDVNRVNTPQEEAKGVGSALRRAREIVSNSSSPTGAAPPPLSAEASVDSPAGQGPSPGSPSSPVVESPTLPAAAPDAAVTAAAEARARAETQPLWAQREVLEHYALHLPEHHMAFEELGFTLTVPMITVEAAEAPATTDEQRPADAPERKPVRVPDAEWDCFDRPHAALHVAANAEETGKGATGESGEAAARVTEAAEGPKVFAFDCEMVLTGNRQSQLARATLVNVRTGQVAFDMLVKPREAVTNYLTRFSGIDEDMLRDVTATLKDCQAALKRFLDTESFIVGHSLENDFKACKMLPNCHVLDSAWLYPHPSGLPYKNALKYLAMRYLGRRIQQGSHDSATDALASADLVYLKLLNGPNFGVRERVSVLALMTSSSSSTCAAGEEATSPVAAEEAEASAHRVEQQVQRDTSKETDGHHTHPSNPPHASALAAGVSVSVHLFDDAQTLTTIMPSGKSSAGANVGAIDAVPVRHDEDATRKMVRALHKRQLAAASDSTRTSADSFSFMWIQLTETRDVDVVMRVPKLDGPPPCQRQRTGEADPPAPNNQQRRQGSTGKTPGAVAESTTTADATESLQAALLAQEAEQLRRVAVVNERVMRIIDACPDESLVVVLAGDCSVGLESKAAGPTVDGEGERRWVCHNQYSQAQGAAFFFVKDHTAPGPEPSPSTSGPASTAPSSSSPGGCARHAEDAGEVINLASPACQPQ